jgi:hypothetical protein
MKAQRCFDDGRLVTFAVYFLGAYAEIWAWRELAQLEIIVTGSAYTGEREELRDLINEKDGG